MLTLTRQGLLLSLSATVIPSQGSSDVPVAVVNDINTYVGYTLEPRVGYYLNGIYKSTVCPYDTSAKTFSVPAEAFKQIGIIDITLALIDNANANHIETCQTVHATVNKAPLGTVVLPDQTTWQDYVNSYINQLFDSNYKPQFDQIQQDLENLVTEAQQQQQTAEQQQTQIDNAISIMGEYQIVSNDPVQIQFKQGDGTFGPTVDLGDGLASKSMVNGGYYQSIGSQYSGAASDYGIEVEEIVGAYSQGSNPSPDNPQEMQAVEIKNLYSAGKNLFDASKLDTTSIGGATVTNNGDGSFTVSGSGNLTNVFNLYYDYSHAESLSLIHLGMLYGKIETSTCPKVGLLMRANGAWTEINLDGISNSKEVTKELLEASDFTIRIRFYGGNGNTIHTGTIKPMFYQGGDGEWQPYKGSDTVTLSEPLILRALPNGVADTWKDGTLTHNVTSVTFDGSDDEAWSYWEVNNSETCRFFITISKPLMYISDNYSICDKLPYILGDVDEEHYRWSSSGVINNQIVIYIKKSRLTANSVSALRTWLASNPITVWYQLATPTTEQLAIPTLQSFYPFTNAWCDSIVQPQQITWNVLTGKSSILDGNGNLIQQGYMTPQDNLLINSDFRSGIINQKGQTQYVHSSGARTYGIDCWYVTGENSSMAINDKFLSLNLHNNGDFGCVLNIDKTNEKYLTFTIQRNLVEAQSVTFDVSTMNVAQDYFFDIDENTKLGIYFWDTDNKKAWLYIRRNGIFNIDYMKLERGQEFTGMPPWNYAFEYFKCCRYLYVWYLPEIPSHGYNSINNLSYFTGTAFPVPFSSAPTWTVKQLLMDQVDVSSDLNTINVTPNRCTSISLTGQISTISGTIIFSNEPS